MLALFPEQLAEDQVHIAFIGMGEAAGAFITGWGADRAGEITAFDIKTTVPATAPDIVRRAAGYGITQCNTLTDAVSDADVVFSTVTADQAITAARAAAPVMKQGAYFLDMNSCAPASKQVSAGIMAEHDVRYVDVAVMEPVYPKQLDVPLLISGQWSGDVLDILAQLSLNFRILEGAVGRASSIKMVRSIMVKGLEALTAECALAAHAADVMEEVFPSLRDGHPNIDVQQRATYNFERSMTHGIRRAAEMDEVAKMVADLGLPNDLARATAHWQRVIADNTLDRTATKKGRDLQSLVDELLPRIRGD